MRTWEGASSFVAVMYHYVRDGFTERWAGIRGLSRAALAEQLDELCRALEPMRWEDVLGGGLPFPMRRSESSAQGFLLTFDDGLSDHFDVVAPLLEERGLRGVFFVPVRAVGERRMLGAHQLHILLAQLGPEELEARVQHWLAARAPECAVLTPEQRREAAAIYAYESAVLATLKYRVHFALSAEVRQEMLDALFATEFGDAADWTAAWYLTPAQAAELQRRGHTLGGHGYSHDPLDRMPPRARQDDLRRSAAWLDETLGGRPRPFSFPFGGFDGEVVLACREAGFAGAFTTRRGWNQAGQSLYELRRVDTIHLSAFLREETACPSS